MMDYVTYNDKVLNLSVPKMHVEGKLNLASYAMINDIG